MGILNELRDEANQKKEGKLSEEQLNFKLEESYQKDILPKMQLIFQFMSELIEYLNFLEHAIKVENYSKNYPQFNSLVQSNYKINTDGFVGFVDHQKIMQVNISFECSGDGVFFLKKKGEIARSRNCIS